MTAASRKAESSGRSGGWIVTAAWILTVLLAVPAVYLSFSVVPMNFVLAAALLAAGAIGAALRVPNWVLPTLLGGATMGLAVGIVLAVGAAQESAAVGFGLAGTVAAFFIVTLRAGDIVGRAMTNGRRA